MPLDKLSEYDEKFCLKNFPSIEKPQLSNLKTHLYKQVLASLETFENIGKYRFAATRTTRLCAYFYNKGLYLQSLKILDKLKNWPGLITRTVF